MNARAIKINNISNAGTDVYDTLYGMTTKAIVIIRYAIFGDMVFVHIYSTNATSNTTSMYISPIPVKLRTTVTQYIPCNVNNAGTTNVGAIDLTGSGDGALWNVLFGPTLDATGFTNSGTKGINGISFTYYKP